jgi:hypothetical protein
LIIACFIYLWKKKVKISRHPSQPPSRSVLDLGNPLETIEMDSFDSTDFQSSLENIYEIPNPIYSNV